MGRHDTQIDGLALGMPRFLRPKLDRKITPTHQMVPLVEETVPSRGRLRDGSAVQNHLLEHFQVLVSPSRQRSAWSQKQLKHFARCWTHRHELEEFGRSRHRAVPPMSIGFASHHHEVGPQSHEVGHGRAFPPRIRSF